MARKGDTPLKRTLALTALQNLREWGFTPIDLPPSLQAETEDLAQAIRVAQLIPMEEKGDCLVIAQAAIWNCDMLLSSDKHLADIERNELNALIKRYNPDASIPLVVRPSAIRKYFR